MLKMATKLRRIRRPLIAVVVAYAVAVQSLLIALGGFAQAAQAGTDVPAFALCHHDADDSATSPVHTPSHSGCNHCIFCFAGAHHALPGLPVLLAQRADVTVEVVRIANAQRLPAPSAYSIAHPRGPPLRA